MNNKRNPYPIHEQDHLSTFDSSNSDNENLGRRKCKDCLLNPNNEESYFGLYKFIANALEVEVEFNSNETLYPCNVVNFFSCPYDEKGRDELFSLNQIAEVIGRALGKALNIKGTRIIYKFDFQLGKVQEIDTFLYGHKFTENLPGGLQIDHKLNEITEE